MEAIYVHIILKYQGSNQEKDAICKSLVLHRASINRQIYDQT